MTAPKAVVAASVALLIGVFGVFALLVWQGYQTTVARAEAKAQTGADVLANETQATIGLSLTMLRHLAAEVGMLSPSDVPTFLDRTFSTLPSKFQLAYYDASGRLVDTVGAAPADISHTGYFADLVRGEEWTLSPQLFEPAASRDAFALANVVRTDRTMVGAFVLTFDASMIDRFHSPLDLGPSSTVSLIRSDGPLVARHPAIDKPLDLGSLPIFKTLLASPNGTYFSPSSPADGVARVVGFRHIDELHLISVASVSQDAVLAGLWTSVWTVLALMGPIALALLVGSAWTASLLRRSESDRNKLSVALTQNETLFREIHHRVKNNLQSVSALMQMQPIPREIKVEMGRRIAAMSAVHEQIYRSNDFATVRLKEYLHRLVTEVHEGSGTQASVTEDIDDLAVDKDSATPLGLLVNEVISNAFKHAFSDGRNGQLSVSLKKTGDGHGELTIRDNGMGFDPEAPSSGIGRKLVAAFAKQVGGETQTWFDSGSAFRLVFPLAGPPAA